MIETLRGISQINLLPDDKLNRHAAESISQARSTIRIAQYLIAARPLPKISAASDVWSELLAAPARGVLCTAILALHPQSHFMRRYNDKPAAQLEDAGWSVKRHPVSSLLHCKIIIVDDIELYIGSHNISQKAATSNRDFSVHIHSRAAAGNVVQWIRELGNSRG